MAEVKERVLWADICKGLLIVLLMISHLVWISRSFHGIKNPVIDSLDIYGKVWGCFFMSCFFMVSGMFSNFNKTAKTFVLSNFKSLIIPALISLVLLNIPRLLAFDYMFFLKYIILYGGSLWFLPALFLSKIVLWGLSKRIRKEWIVFSILVAFSFLGSVLDEYDVFPNYWFHRHFLNFSLYLGLGYYYKDLILKKATGIFCSILFLLTILILLLNDLTIPNVVSGFNETLWQHPLTIWLSITGSITCIHLCKLIKHSNVLEYLGRNSLIIYIYHMVFLYHCVTATSPSFNQTSSIIDSIFLIIMAVTCTLLLNTLLCKVIDMKFFKWIKGAF